MLFKTINRYSSVEVVRGENEHILGQMGSTVTFAAFNNVLIFSAYAEKIKKYILETIHNIWQFITDSWETIITQRDQDRSKGRGSILAFLVILLRHHQRLYHHYSYGAHGVLHSQH